MAFEDYTPEEVEAIVKRYEFLAEFADYIKIVHSDGGNNKLYHERSGIESLNDTIDSAIEDEKSISEEDEEEDEDDDYAELSF